eukprot:CAMPEP_0177629942 /NCGR_PEP_ID=MMETSP0447-20121125/941_1 /TAXON_ID=0 /ORGANISM="Stygamoeba regulata, Strain BSH-02190019" /LENGTH=346 /DNA_ID=CAMNT_0019131305 /DNA_START=118 /DNA_END=1160 /DNA_ORIENTATION=-
MSRVIRKNCVLRHLVALLEGPLSTRVSLDPAPADAHCVPLDRISLKVVFCQQVLEWIILFDFFSDVICPDFFFPENPELLLHPLTAKCLALWDPDDVHSLASVICAFLTIHREVQKEKILRLGCAKLDFELSTLPNQKVEYCLSDVYTDFSELSPMQQAPAISLLVVFDLHRADSPHVELILPEPLAILNDLIQLPHWSKDMCLNTFLHMVSNLVDAQLSNLKARKDFSAELISAFGRPHEYDSLLWQRISFFFEWQQTMVILQFEMPPNFPKERPTIRVGSILQVMGTSGGGASAWPLRPLQTTINHHAYSTSPAEFVAMLKRNILEDAMGKMLAVPDTCFVHEM